MASTSNSTNRDSDFDVNLDAHFDVDFEDTNRLRPPESNEDPYTPPSTDTPPNTESSDNDDPTDLPESGGKSASSKANARNI